MLIQVFQTKQNQTVDFLGGSVLISKEASKIETIQVRGFGSLYVLAAPTPPPKSQGGYPDHKQWYPHVIEGTINSINNGLVPHSHRVQVENNYRFFVVHTINSHSILFSQLVCAHAFSWSLLTIN